MISNYCAKYTDLKTYMKYVYFAVLLIIPCLHFH